MNVLFVCNQNEHRSKTAEELFDGRFTTRSAGLYNEKPVTQHDLDWAELVVVMESEQRSELGDRFPKQYLHKRIICLDVPDVYRYQQPELMELLAERMDTVLRCKAY